MDITSVRKVKMQDEVDKHNTKPSQDKLFSVISDFKAEIQKVTWTEKKELLSYTKVVMGCTFVFGLGIYLVDLAINTCMHGLSTLVKIIAG